MFNSLLKIHNLFTKKVSYIFFKKVSDIDDSVIYDCDCNNNFSIKKKNDLRLNAMA